MHIHPLDELFQRNPDADIIIFVDYDDGGPYGLHGNILKIGPERTENTARFYASMPASQTENGLIEAGMIIRAEYIFERDGHQAVIFKNKNVYNENKNKILKE